MRLRRAVVLAVVLGAVAAPAWAHVSVEPEQAGRGSTVDLTFSVPNERPSASTVRVEIVFPTDHTIATATPRRVAGWTATVQQAASGAVDRVVWEDGTIPPDGEVDFVMGVGPLPGDADRVVFKALQHYDSGEVVAWIEEPGPGGDEPEHPAPVVELTGPAVVASTTAAVPGTSGTTLAPATTVTTATDEGDEGDGGTWWPIAALGVGAALVVVAVVVLLRSRQQA